MSLINQALRKAQRDRTPDRMSQPGEQSPAAYASTAASGMSPALVIGLVIAVAVLIGLVVGLSVVIFKGDDAPTKIAQSETTPSPEPASATLEGTPEPVEAPLKAIQPTISQKVEVAQTETTPAPSVVDELRKAREAAEAQAAAEAKLAAEKAAAEAKAAEEAAARAAAKPSEDIIQWLGTAKISGVKISDTESKVILNGKSYSVGEFANFKLGLKVLLIQENRILFVDNNGKKYMKRL